VQSLNLLRSRKRLARLVAVVVLVRHLSVDAQLRRVGQRNRGMDVVGVGDRGFDSGSFVVEEQRFVGIAQEKVAQVTLPGRRRKGSFDVGDGPLPMANLPTAIGDSHCG